MQRKTVEQILFALVIFLVPTNLFLKTVIPSAYVHGILVDYLLPRFYLSDIPVFLLLAMWIPKIPRHVWKAVGLSLVFAVLHVAVHLTSPSLTSTIWFLAKILEMGLFIAWIIYHQEILKTKLVYWVIILAVLFQSLVAFAQYRTQHTIFGYWFLGESNLSMSSSIAKTDYVGSLKILPYGTTAHPNILAGVIALFLLIALNNSKHRSMTFLTVVVGGIVIFLTESVTATSALGAGLVMVTLRKKQFSAKIVPGIAGVMIAACMSIFFIPMSRSTSFGSITRRGELASIAERMIVDHPLIGVGINQFTATMEQYGTVSANLKFLQPAHNVPLLWFSETGWLGIIFLLLLYRFEHDYYSTKKGNLLVFLLPLAIILSLDHYLYSVQSGQLLFAIMIGMMIQKKDVVKPITSSRVRKSQEA